MPSAGDGGGGRGCVSNLVFSAIILWKPIPTPSMTASRIAHPIAPFLTARGPPRTASAPPVKNPAMIAFHGSSFLLSTHQPKSDCSHDIPYLLPNTFYSTVECREESTPDTKVTAENRRSRLDRGEGYIVVRLSSLTDQCDVFHLLSYARHMDCF